MFYVKRWLDTEAETHTTELIRPTRDSETTCYNGVC